MCGGRGTRMKMEYCMNEKPLLDIKGKTLLERVIDALIDSQSFSKIIGVSSYNTPKTSRFLHYRYRDLVEIVKTEGTSYSRDLSSILYKLKPSKTFVVSADLPLLNPNTIKKIINLCAAFDVACISVVLEKYFVKNLGIEPSIVFNIGKKEYCHSGIAIVDSSQFKSQDDLDEYYVVMNEKEIAVNVNTPMELNLAEKLIYNN